MNALPKNLQQWLGSNATMVKGAAAPLLVRLL